MAYRFIDTNFFRSPFVRDLKGTFKSLYGYIITDCSAAGIWTVDIPVACIYIDAELKADDVKKVFIDSGKAIDLGNGKWFFPDFIQHQYPKGLNVKNPAHNNVIFELKKYNLIDEKLSLKEVPKKGPSGTFEVPQGGTMVMVKVMDKDTEEGKGKVTGGEVEKTINPELSEKFICEPKPSFTEFWDMYEKKVGDTKKIKKKWDSLSQADRESIMAYIPGYKQSQPDKQYRKNPETFLNNRAWKDELIFKSNDTKHTDSAAEPERKLGRIPISQAEEFMRTRTGIAD